MKAVLARKILNTGGDFNSKCTHTLSLSDHTDRKEDIKLDTDIGVENQRAVYRFPYTQGNTTNTYNDVQAFLYTAHV